MDAVAQAERAMQAAQAAEHRDMALLRQAALLVGRTPAKISLLHCDTKRGRRVYLNPGAYRFTIEHLVSYSVADAAISTTAALVKSKTDLMSERPFDLRWLPPVPVNVVDTAALNAVVWPVK